MNNAAAPGCVTYSRTAGLPWGLAGGQGGSANRGEIHRADGRIEPHNMATAVSVKQGELIRTVMGHHAHALHRRRLA